MTPYEEVDLGQFKSEDFIRSDASVLIQCKASMDSLKVSGNDYFEIGKVNAGLQSSGYKIQPVAGASNVNLAGWVGFGYETIMFGYSIDGGDAIFNTYPTAPGQAVIDAGGEYAQRFSITVPLRNLSVGEHTLDFLALVDVEGGVAVKLLSLTVEISKIYTADEFMSTAQYPVKLSLDSLTATDSIKSGTQVAFPEGTENLNAYGWVGFNDKEILKLGYSIDGGNAIFNSSPIAPGQGVIDAGGQYAKRFSINLNVSDLTCGSHDVYLLALIEGGVAVKFLKITVVITKEFTNTEFKSTDDTSVNFKKTSLDSITAEGGSKEGNKITISKGTSKVSASGWVGFNGYKIAMLGYGIDGGDAIFNSFPSGAEAGVLSDSNGGSLAKRYTININTAELDVGEHPVYLLALIEANGGVTVKFSKIIIIVTE